MLSALARRSIHTSPIRLSGGHGEYHHLPFALPHKSKAAFAVKLTAFVSLGFAIPFIAGSYQIRKSQGGGSSA